jgi:hypothetical protein
MRPVCDIANCRSALASNQDAVITASNGLLARECAAGFSKRSTDLAKPTLAMPTRSSPFGTLAEQVCGKTTHTTYLRHCWPAFLLDGSAVRCPDYSERIFGQLTVDVGGSPVTITTKPQMSVHDPDRDLVSAT